jgi:hypothetical protein
MIEKFGKTETEGWAGDNLKCRQIIAEILNFGVSQEQVCKLIYLLSLELENRDLMLQIIEIINNNPENTENTVSSAGIIT